MYTPVFGSEGRFTNPRKDCPHPERWHSEDEDSTEIEVSYLVGAFVIALQPGSVIETGTAWGQTAEAIGKALRSNGQGELVTFEPDFERAEYSRTRCKGLAVTVASQSSLDPYDIRQVDFAWFDSLIELRVKEFLHFRQFMHANTVVGFHDTGPQHNLRGGIEQLRNLNYIDPIFLPTPRGVCFARVLGFES